MGKKKGEANDDGDFQKLKREHSEVESQVDALIKEAKKLTSNAPTVFGEMQALATKFSELPMNVSEGEAHANELSTSLGEISEQAKQKLEQEMKNNVIHPLEGKRKELKAVHSELKEYKRLQLDEEAYQRKVEQSKKKEDSRLQHRQEKLEEAGKKLREKSESIKTELERLTGQNFLKPELDNYATIVSQFFSAADTQLRSLP